MGQVMNKSTSTANPSAGGDGKHTEKLREELRSMVKNKIDKRYPKFDVTTKDWEKNKFYYEVYAIIEEINEERGAMQFKLPNGVDLEKIFTNHRRFSLGPLTKKQFQDIVQEVITFESFYVGQRAKDLVLYILGIPTVAFFAKRILLGSTSAISDDVFIPAVTSATVIYLAKTNKI